MFTYNGSNGEKSSGALLGNLGKASFLERAGSHKKVWSRADAVRSAKAIRPEYAAYRPRIARVKALPKINGFHVVGLGALPHITQGELKIKLGANGFTGYRVGGLTFKLFKAA